MKIYSIYKKIELLKREYRKTITFGIPIGIRLFLVLVVLVLTIFLGMLAILVITGTLTAGISENKKFVENELLHVSPGILQNYGQLSLYAVEFSKALSKSIKDKADELEISLADLRSILSYWKKLYPMNMNGLYSLCKCLKVTVLSSF